jgi:EAL domain-containing protein (putative c-di-GMP-specific phosphodiesterase class I)/CheY-like chemotaxis protein
MDDDPAVIDLVAGVAGPLGFMVRRAADQSALSDALASYGPDAVLLDPEADQGRAIQSLDAVSKAGAMLLLLGPPDARGVVAARGRAQRAGVDVAGILPKPLLHEGLETALRSLRGDAPIYAAQDIAEAVMRGEIGAWYQPQVVRSARGWRVDGAEALARWQHPEHGLVLPDAFVPTAEAEGQIAAITDCVLRTAVEQLGVWSGQGLALRIGVNLSPSLVTDPDFPERLNMLAREYDVPARLLVLEIPEPGLEHAGPAFLGMLARLRIHGFSLALEHFGSGVSSLADLYQTPFSELKIDRRLTARLENDEDAQRLVRAIVALGREMGLAIAAEAVESRDVLDFLHAAGCERAQGYVVSRPLPATAFQALVAEWNSTG